MTRIAAIDLGTNTALLTVAEPDGAGRVLRPVEEAAVITRLGRGLGARGPLDRDAAARSLAVLVDFSRRCRALGVEPAAVRAVATSALRRADDGPAFIEAAMREAGLRLEVIGGEREAWLTYLPQAREHADGLPPDGVLVALDVGGGSAEIVQGRPGRGRPRTGGPGEPHATGGARGGGPGEAALDAWACLEGIGSVRLTESFIGADPPPPDALDAVRTHVETRLRAEVPRPARGTPLRLVATAGTATTLGAVHLALDPYDGARVHGLRLSRGAIEALLARLAALALAERARLPGLEPGRADVICAGAVVVAAVLAHFGAGEAVLSDRGVRWGLLYEAAGARAGA